MSLREPGQLVGMVFDQTYRITSLLGAGDMALVYKAIDKNLGIELAIKLLHLEMLSSKESFARFQREAEVLKTLFHPNIIGLRLFKLTCVGQPYVVMDFLNGTPLDRKIEETGGLAPQEAVQLSLQVCEALSHAHERGIIHRDLKPGNIMIMKEGSNEQNAILLDFGIAKILEPVQAKQSQSLTRTGQVFGTPFYMSPEQWRGEQSDWRSDIYSMGIVLYEMIAGSRPFDVETLAAVVFGFQDCKPPALSELRPELIVSLELQATIAKAMSLDKESRYQSVAELKRDLMKTGEFKALTTGKTQRPSTAQLFRKNKPKVILLTVFIFSLTVGLLLADGFSGSSGRFSTSIASTLAEMVLKPSDPLLINLRLHLADLLYQSSEFKEALKEYKKLDSSMQLGMKIESIALVRTRIAQAAYKSGLDQEQVNFLAFEAAISQLNLALEELKAGKFEQCMGSWRFVQECKTLGSKQSEFKSSRKETLIAKEAKLAGDLYESKKPELSLQVWRSILEDSKIYTGRKSAQTVNALFMMGCCEVNLHDYHSAEEHFQQALDIAMEAPEKQLKSRIVEILFGLGNAQSLLGKYAESAETYKQSVERSRAVLRQTTLPLAEKLYNLALKLKKAKLSGLKSDNVKRALGQ